MYNRNYGGFDYVRIHSELLNTVLNPKIIANLAVTDGYTRPLCLIWLNLCLIRKMTKLITTLFFFVVCNTAFGQNQIKKSDLIGCWKYYPEESKFYPNIVVYRPCDYSSFNSKRIIRGRFKMNLKANGKCSYLSIGATDINTMKPGRWNFDSNKNEIEIFDLKNNSIRKFKIDRVKNGLLGIKKTKHNKVYN